MIEDLQWLGIRWSEGPDCGGDYGPYTQSERCDHYLEAWRRSTRWRIHLPVYVFAEGFGAGSLARRTIWTTNQFIRDAVAGEAMLPAFPNPQG